MSDFQFLKNPMTDKRVISAPRRAHRPDGDIHKVVCPFCPGNEGNDEVYRIASGEGVSDWTVRVIANKYPFTQHHEVIIHSPDHKHSFDTLPLMQVELILYTYRQRYNQHAKQGQVYIFHNHSHEAGESIHHPHSQLVVVPFDIKLDIPPLASAVSTQVVNEELPWFTQKWWGFSPEENGAAVPPVEERVETAHYYISCPASSEWPDEVWIAPKQTGDVFGSVNDSQIKDLAFVLGRLIQIFDLRHGQEFPFNFYIYPRENWYIRLIPRVKVLGGFEVGTGVMVNTQDPAETMAFIKEHFHEPNHEKIKTQHQANYRKKV